MKRFLRDVLFTLIFVFFADYLFGTFDKNIYTEKYAYITNHSNDIKTLVMGNSIAESGFNTGVLGDSAWCFAISGRALYYDAELLKRHLPKMNNLRTVILLLHYNLHTDAILSENKKYYIYNNYRYLHVPVYSFPDGWLYRSALLSDQLHKKSNNENNDRDKYGHLRVDNIFDGSKQDDNPPNQRNVEKGIEFLTSMAQTCAEYGVRFIVVTPPFPNIWLQGCTEQGISNLTMITDSVNHSFSLEYKNYMYDSVFRNDSLYSNWNHLNHFGSTLFAQRVKQDFGL